MIQPQNPNLKEITTPIQAKRGNRQFFDTKHKVSYITYANGYVRREVKVLCVSPYNNESYKCQDQFVINKRSYPSKRVIKEPCPQKRMDIIDHHSTNYRGYKGRFADNRYTCSVTIIEK